MKIYNEVTTIFNDSTGKWETLSEDSYDYNGNDIILAQNPDWSKRGWAGGASTYSPVQRAQYATSPYGDAFSNYGYESPFYSGGYSRDIGSTYAPQAAGLAGEATGLRDISTLSPYLPYGGYGNVFGLGAVSGGASTPYSAQSIVDLISPQFELPTSGTAQKWSDPSAADWVHIQQDPYEQYRHLRYKLFLGDFGGLKGGRWADRMTGYTHDERIAGLHSMGDIYGTYTPTYSGEERDREKGITEPTPQTFKFEGLGISDFEDFISDKVRAGELKGKSSEEIRQMLETEFLKGSNIPTGLVDEGPLEKLDAIQKAKAEGRLGLNISHFGEDYFDKLVEGMGLLGEGDIQAEKAVGTSLTSLLEELKSDELGGGSTGIEGLLYSLQQPAGQIGTLRGQIADKYGLIGEKAEDIAPYLAGGEKYEEQEEKAIPIEADIKKEKEKRGVLKRTLKKNLSALLKGYKKSEKSSRYGGLTGKKDTGTTDYKGKVREARKTYSKGLNTIAEQLGVEGTSDTSTYYGRLQDVLDVLSGLIETEVEPREQSIEGYEDTIRSYAEQIGLPGQGAGIYGQMGPKQEGIINQLQSVFDTIHGKGEGTIEGILQQFKEGIEDKKLMDWTGRISELGAGLGS